MSETKFLGYDQHAVEVIQNLAMLVRRLCYRQPDEKLVEQSMNYLHGEKLDGNVLRQLESTEIAALRALLARVCEAAEFFADGADMYYGTDEFENSEQHYAAIAAGREVLKISERERIERLEEGIEVIGAVGGAAKGTDCACGIPGPENHEACCVDYYGSLELETISTRQCKRRCCQCSCHEPSKEQLDAEIAALRTQLAERDAALRELIEAAKWMRSNTVIRFDKESTAKYKDINAAIARAAALPGVS